jgi:hypothetical protein
VKIICAWCQQAGEQTLLDELELYDRRMISHGICKSHTKLVLNKVRGPLGKKRSRRLGQKRRNATARSLTRFPDLQTARPRVLKGLGLSSHLLSCAQLRFPFSE